MKYMFLAVSSFLAIVAQIIAGKNFFLFNFLDLSLILIAYWAIYRSRVQALFVGSITGILLDAVFSWPLGFNGFSKTLAAFIIGQVAKRFNVEESWMRFVLIGASSIVSSFTMYALFGILQRSYSNIFLGASAIQALVTAVVGVLFFAALDTYNEVQVKKASQQ